MTDSNSWRTCTSCGETKTEREFYSDGIQKGRRRPKRRAKCRQCTRAQMRKRLDLRRADVDAYKIASGCADCGWNLNPRALEFDHIPGRGKRAEIARLVAGKRPMSEVWDEIAKCEVVCANCHRIRTFERECNNRDWDLRYSSRAADELPGRHDDGPPPFEQLTLEV